MNKKLPSYLYVNRSAIHGRGLYTKTRIEHKTFLGSYMGRRAFENGPHVLWTETNDGRAIGRHGQNNLRYLNHSKKPCCEFVGFDLYALRDITSGEELTIDYGYDPEKIDEL